ncbi:MAG TPA: saccharopine dehydrogenase C-terminal domain-containing protein, partial [Ohtaekwangia sp.]|nr:saccharopine dehydrogenase C-terminal domain-containing protein [Ohtaekwangia sp.]
ESQGVSTIQTDLQDIEKLKQLVADFDLIIGAVPGFMGFATAKAVIESGRNMVDISFFPEDPFELDELAKKHNVTVVTDCGVAPGMGNIILGYHNQAMQVTDYECLVGGLPLVREWPWEYRAVFSPIDVIEEYIRPARFVQNGALVVREALSDPELVHFAEVGTLESWNSDGLRTLIQTMPDIPNMIEKTLRYPGTIRYLQVLRDTGFFSYEEIDINGNKIRPVDLTARLLFPQWQLKKGEREFTVMRIRISGLEEGENCSYQYDVLDYTDTETGTLSMARTTGFTCTAAAHLVADGRYSRKGISPPEYLGEDPAHFHFIREYLEKRGVKYHVSRN